MSRLCRGPRLVGEVLRWRGTKFRRRTGDKLEDWNLTNHTLLKLAIANSFMTRSTHQLFVLSFPLKQSPPRSIGTGRLFATESWDSQRVLIVYRAWKTANLLLGFGLLFRERERKSHHGGK